MRLKRLTPNKPHHGLGEFGKQRQKAPLSAGAHMPEKIGSHSGKGNGEGLPATRKAGRGTPSTHFGDAGRGGSGRHGKADNYKGKPTGMSESISHEAFERLGSD